MFIRFQHMHSEGKTLEGCFEAVNLFVPVHDLIRTPYIEVKLDSIPMEAFKPYTDEGGDKDLMRLRWIAENVMLSSETELPADLAQLFELLRTEPIKNKDCEPKETKGESVWLYVVVQEATVLAKERAQQV
uniref:Uncharacterized protein n=1 Tax=Arundo donax TaxID=35708 RepID=A0A0A8Z7J5_ARUDO